MITQDETGHVEITVPLCHWCGEQLSGECENGLHKACAEELNANDQPWQDRHARLVKELRV